MINAGGPVVNIWNIYLIYCERCNILQHIEAHWITAERDTTSSTRRCSGLPHRTLQKRDSEKDRHGCICTPLTDRGVTALHWLLCVKHVVRGKLPSGILNLILVFRFGLQMLQPGKQDWTSFYWLGKHWCDEWSSHHDITLQADGIHVQCCNVTK